MAALVPAVRPGTEARADIDACAELADHLDHAFRVARADVHDRGCAASDCRPEAEELVLSCFLLVGRIRDPALADGVGHEVAAEEVGAGVVEQKDVARVRAEMQVAVDQPWTEETASRVDGAVDLTFELLANVQDGVAFVHDEAIPDEHMRLPVEADDPTSPNEGAHGRPC
jgi:hypothetical protein